MIRARLSELGETPFAVERQHGLPSDAIRNIVRGDKKSLPSVYRAKLIADALGLEFYFGPVRDDGQRQPSPLPTRQAGALDLDADDFASIRLHDIEASAGPGRTPTDEDPVGALAFRRSWLARERVRPDRAAAIRVRGDSMSPTLRDGDIILIRFDAPGLADGGFRDGGIYVIRADGEIHVKRMFRSGRMIVAVSDDLTTSPMVFNGAHPGFAFVGDVIWTGRQLGGLTTPRPCAPDALSKG